jgi:hypothetical protein
MAVPVLDDLSLQQLVWLVPVFFAIHNAEEAPLMERWTRQLPPGTVPEVNTLRFTVAVILLTLLTIVVAAFVAASPENSVTTFAMLLTQATIFVNALVPHAASTIRFRRYSPGVVSGLLINVPFSLYLFRRLLQGGTVGWSGLVIALVLAPIVMVLLARGSLMVADTIVDITGVRDRAGP